MKKATRDLKKHYRFVERQLRSFSVDLSDDSWYNLWHRHLDWDGTTDTSERQRKIHIQYYMKMLDTIDTMTKGSKREFQTWIYLDGYRGCNDAVYFHTQNPCSEFPIKLGSIELDNAIPKILIELSDLSNYIVRKLINKEDGVYSYIVQKRALGLEVK